MIRKFTPAAPCQKLQIRLILVVVTAVTVFACREENPPNVILIIVDTLRADHLPFYGYEHDTMPLLSRWVDETVVFENCLSPIPITTPAISSIFTGLYPRNHGVRNTGEALDDHVLTTAEYLSKAGYQTAAFASVSGMLTQLNVGQGFAVQNDETLLPSEQGDHPWHTPEGAEMWQRRAEEVTDAALTWLNQEAGEPYFLFVHYFDPHAYYDPPSPFRDHFPPEKHVPTPPGLRSWWGDVSDLGKTTALYDGEILTVDFHLDRLVQRLRESGSWNRSLVVFTADHGESLGEHGHMDHGEWLYQEQIRVPLVVRFPRKFRGGKRLSTTVGLIDVHPTILDLVDLPLAEELSDGRSLAPLLSGRKYGDRPLFIESEPCRVDHILTLGMECWPPGVQGKLRGVLFENWKLIRTPLQGYEKLQLFDLSSDPRELENHSNDQVAATERLNILLGEFWGDGGRTGIQDRDLLEKLRSLGYVETYDTPTNRTPNQRD